MRTIRVEERRSDHTWAWVAAAILGIAAGVLISRRVRAGKRASRSLLGRGRKLATTVVDNFGPMMDTVQSLRDAWNGSDDEDEEGLDDELDAELEAEIDDDLDEEEDDEDDEDDDLEDEDLDEDEVDEEDEDEEEEDEEEEDEEAEANEASAIDARVLEAFSNDPILAERAVEIEEIGDGDIVLHGRVRNAKEVKHAMTLARGVPGVTRVRQKLTVWNRR